MASADYRNSIYTPLKQERLRYLIDLNLKIVRGVLKKHPWAIQNYLYIDLHSGPGKDPEGEAGSPLIMLQVARELSMPCQAWLYEQDPDNAATLESLVSPYRNPITSIDVRACDHKTLEARLPGIAQKGQYGIVYADPSNATLPVHLLECVAAAYPRLDIVINLACASYKRTCKYDSYESLIHVLRKFNKELWFVTSPLHKHQWTVMLGTNWNEYPEVKGFYSIYKRTGREILETVGFTKSQRQPPLFDVPGISETS